MSSDTYFLSALIRTNIVLIIQFSFNFQINKTLRWLRDFGFRYA
ncbi:hypothetical protein MNBD_GAMMA07-1338 [hydrothermal vent metagenome]|uniref:Uncharacterized protein n=1 Tax=hydrothermal vent metagenome TaxID=652676 RepID=A0A3B0WYU2_9ZZZZ